MAILAGLLFGGFAAFLAAVSAIATIWLGEGRRNHIAFLIVCALWCCFWTATEFFAVEGRGIGWLIMGVGLVAAGTAWISLRWQPPRIVRHLLSLAGAIFLALYIYVAGFILK